MKEKTVAVHLHPSVCSEGLLAGLRREGYRVVGADEFSSTAHIRSVDGRLVVSVGTRSITLRDTVTPEELSFWLNELSWRGRRKAGARCPLELRVEVAHESSLIETTTLDISSSGLFFVSAAPPPLGSAVGLVLHLDDGHEPLKTLGQIVHVVSDRGADLGDEAGVNRCAHPGAAVDLVGLSKQGRERMGKRVARYVVEQSLS